MKAKTLTTLSVLNDLRHAAFEALQRKHRLPALLLLYSFIDVCASLACDAPRASNAERFKRFLERYYGPNWSWVTPDDLWAARSSMLHAFSPIGRKTKAGHARPIFYYGWPETKEKVKAVLELKGHAEFLLLDVSEIKGIAVRCFNSFWRRVESESDFEDLVLLNAEHLSKDLFHHSLEAELASIEVLVALSEKSDRESES